MLDENRQRIEAEFARSWNDAEDIAWRRKMRRRQQRHAHLYPTIIGTTLFVMVVVVFIWHPY